MNSSNLSTLSLLTRDSKNISSVLSVMTFNTFITDWDYLFRFAWRNCSAPRVNKFELEPKFVTLNPFAPTMIYGSVSQTFSSRGP